MNSDEDSGAVGAVDQADSVGTQEEPESETSAAAPSSEADETAADEAVQRVYSAVRDGPVGSQSAAFFDLDKTVLAKSSALAFSRRFYEQGLIKRADALRTAYGQFVYMLSGADHEQMEQARLFMSEMVKGWPISQVKEIVAETLDATIDPTIYEEAMQLFDLHRAAGHDVVIISSSGTEVVEPIGDRLGADLAIGTQMVVEDGKYTGEILFYAYGEQKAEAMEALAAERGYDLAQCFAYSDSFTDMPMLEIVGNPTATNPDGPLREEASDRGWNTVDFSKPVAMRTPLETKGGRAAAAVAVGSAVALGVAWYATHRGSKS